MLNLREIYKPKTIGQAVKFLGQPDTVLLAGGTELIARKRRDVRALVDLSGLGLAYIRDKNGAIAIGAMTTLADATNSPILRAVTNGVIAQAAHRTGTSILRNQATVVGTLIAEPNGILATTFLALNSMLFTAESNGETGEARGQENPHEGIAVEKFLGDLDPFISNALVTEIVIPRDSLNRRLRIETVARTPRDVPIVSVCVALEMDHGVVTGAKIALGGVADIALRAQQAEMRLEKQRLGIQVVEAAAREAMENTNGISDFRASVEYRREMVSVLVRRALNQLRQVP